MALDGIKDLIEELNKTEGKNVWIHISHKLFGDQNLKCAFQLFDTEKHLGFLIGEQKIYIDKKDICDIGIKGELFYFADEIMCIKIRKL